MQFQIPVEDVKKLRWLTLISDKLVIKKFFHKKQKGHFSQNHIPVTESNVILFLKSENNIFVHNKTSVLIGQNESMK